MSRSRAARLLVAGMIALAALSLTAGQASASRGLRVTNGVTLWAAEGNTNVNFGGGLAPVCVWRIGMRIQPQILKVTLAQIAQVLLSGMGSSITCPQPMTGTILNDIVIGYTGFTGTLPAITSILGRANNFRFLYFLPTLGLSCLYNGPLNFVFTRNAAGSITNVTINGVLPRDPASPAGCPANATVNGNLNIQLPLAPVIALL